MLQNENNNKKIKCNTVHNGIKCEKCFKEPIIGYRYKCSTCTNYNLCEDCEEKNAQTGEHPHEFIKMRKHVQYNFNNNNFNNNNFKNNNFVDINNINNNNNNKNPINDINDFNNFDQNNIQKNNHNNNNQIKNFNNNNIIKNNDDNNEFELFQFGEEYSFECLNNQNLKAELEQGYDMVSLKIILKNNGISQWPLENAKLIPDPQKNISGEDIILEPQIKGEEKEYEAYFRDLKHYPAGNYNAGYNFEINGKKYGDTININILIKEKKENNNDNDYQNIINDFRNDLSLDKDEYSDEKLLKALKSNNFDKSAAFGSLFE